MTNAEMHAHFMHLLGGHATDVDGCLGDVDAKLTEALDKIDGLEAAFNSKLDAKFQELLTRLPPHVRHRARRVPLADVPAGTAPAAAAAHDAPSDEGYVDYGGNEDEQVDENALDDEKVQQPAPGRPRQLNRHARPPPRPVHSLFNRSLESMPYTLKYLGSMWNDGPSMDEEDKHWSMITHGGDGSKHLRIEDDATSTESANVDPDKMTNAEMHAHFIHLLGGHSTDVDGRLGDVDAKLTEALDKIDGLEASFNSKLDAKFQELLTRLPPPVRRRARRVPLADVPAGTAPAAAAAHDAPSDEGCEDYGGNEDEQVDENALDDEEVQQPAPGRPRQLNRHVRPPPRPVRDDDHVAKLKLNIPPFEDMASPINFNQFLEKEKLKSNGSNFTDWFRHVRIFLNGGNLQYVLDAPLGDPPAETDEVKNVYATRKTRYSQVQCAILCSLEADLQKSFEHHDPHELVNELKTIFETHAAVECYEASKHFFSCMMEEGSSVSEHMLAMTGHAKKLMTWE
ncbi:hypothetical protein QYE76_041730 [Lolium multiflorum]|uniref:Uncharacterized protein n=1 Tax=Lolium multiflorum TaxID=4521 RepID=A0AAD8WU20_LOLMU|nr:hypothetical protein QYE76_041730 [Lolium multiflorum]